MSISNFILHIVSAITRRIPYFRNLGHLYRKLNALMLRLGAGPLVTANMKDGTRILVDLRTITQIEAYYRGEYDANLTRVIRSLLNIDSCFLDVGANIGFYTIFVGAFFRSRGGSGKVIAFEPLPGNHIRLLENIASNDLAGFCSVERVGLSNISADSLITLREDFLHGSSTGNAAIPTNEQFDQGFERVPIRLEPLDTIWKRIDAGGRDIDIIKIDIEGHEDFCLQGGKQTIQRYRPTILMEVNKPYYAARGVELDSTFLPLIPERYSVFRRDGGKWGNIQSFNECSKVDNVFLVPEERLALAHYRVLSPT